MGIFDDEDTDEARVHAAACAVADAWAHAAQKRMADYTDLHDYAPGLPEALEKLELATRSSPLRKVRP